MAWKNCISRIMVIMSPILGKKRERSRIGMDLRNLGHKRKRWTRMASSTPESQRKA